MKFERFIRLLPTLLLAAAAADFIKQCLFVASTWQGVRYFGGLSSGDGLYLKVLFAIVEQAFGIVLYPLGWVASAMTLIVLLSIHDRGRAANAQA